MKIKKLQRKLAEKDLDVFLARQNAPYLAETPAADTVLVTGRKSLLLCGRLNYDRAKKEGKIRDVRAFAETKLPLREDENVSFGKFGEIIGGILEELGAAKVGFDELGVDTLKEIQENYEAKYQRESDLVWDLRKIKTPEEIKRLKKSAEIAGKGIERGAELIGPGRTEIEIAGEIEYEMRKLGSEGTPFDTIVAGGVNSCFPHAGASRKKLREGELVIIDLGARWKDYGSDVTRTFTISPNRQQEKMLEITEKAQGAALSKVEAGVRAKEIDKVARKVFRDNGYEEFYLHGTGHGVGMEVHEPPDLNPSSEDSLERGMVITIEPGIYIQDVGGCRLEDMVLVGEDGYEKLTST